MGNYSCRFHEQLNDQANIIDIQKNMMRSVDLPMTAAELMLEEPGRFVARLTDVRRDLRLAAMKIDELLTGGGVYVLNPVGRVNGKISEAEKVMIESVCGRRRSRRRSSSRVLPVVAETATENPFRLSEKASGIEIAIHRAKQWKPALESIEEGI